MKTTQYTFIKILSLVASLTIISKAVANDKYPLANENKSKANFSLMLDPSMKLILGEKQASVSSKSYYQSVTGAELQKGVNIYTSGSGAVIRLTPMSSTKTAFSSQSLVIDPNLLVIVGQSGEVKANSESMALIADSSQLKQSYPELFESTAAFKLSDTMGVGTFTLKSSQNLNANAKYMVNVFDKNSSHSLQVESKTNSFQFNDSLKIKSHLTALMGPSSIQATASLIAPDGRKWPLTLRKQGNYLNIDTRLDMDTERQPGKLWKVVVDLSAKHNQALIKRTAELAIDIHSQTAKVNKLNLYANNATLNIDVLRSGRYEARAWLFAKDANQKWQPAMLVYAASWFDVGENQLQLSIDKTQLTNTGFSDNIKIGQIQLLDQSRLAVLATKTGNWQVINQNSLTNR